jgi:hypothetical protein
MARPAKPLQRRYASTINSLFLGEGSHGGPLFPNATDLGRAIVALPTSGYQNAESIIGYVNQVLRGESSCSAKLQEALRAVALDRLTEAHPDVRQAWLARFEQALSELHNGLKIYYDASLGKGELKPRTSCFVICPFFASARHTKNGRHMLRLFLTTHGITLDPVLHESSRGVPYTFCFPNEEDLVDFWSAALEEAFRDDEGTLTVPPPAEAESRLNEVADRLVELEQDNYIRTYLLPYNACLVPVALYDLAEPISQGAVMVYQGDQFNFLRLLPQYIGPWKRFHEEFVSGTISGTKQVRFAEVRDALLSKSRASLLADGTEGTVAEA